MKYHFQLHNAYATLQYFATSEFVDAVADENIMNDSDGLCNRGKNL
jgi:hypothetical protein